MNKEIFDLIDELAKPAHDKWWYQLNDELSAIEKYNMQKADMYRQELARKLKQLLYENEQQSIEAEINKTIEKNLNPTIEKSLNEISKDFNKKK